MKKEILKEFDKQWEKTMEWCEDYSTRDVNGSSAIEIKQFLSQAIDKTREETIKDILRSVKENQKGQFEDNGGQICWYLNGLEDLLNKILQSLKDK